MSTRRSHGSRPDTSPQPDASPITCEVEVIPGLEAMADAELQERLGRQVTIEPSLKEGLLPIVYAGDLRALLELKTVLAVYGQRWFPMPRPKALLGNQEFAILISMIEVVRDLHAPDTFRTFRISAAGEDSAVLQRLRERIAQATALDYTHGDADLLIRLRRPLNGDEGWEVLIRLSPRPLATRSWRVRNFAGALNASVAHAMVRLTQPHPDDAVLNLCCGSGTLIVERLLWGTARLALACDYDPEVLAAAHANVQASGFTNIKLYPWDAAALPIPDASIDVVLVDLPFGQLVGSHEANTVLYPRVVSEAARVTIPGGLLAAITQDIRLWERTVEASDHWSLYDVLPIKLPFGSGYLHPRIYLLRRTTQSAPAGQR